MRLFQWSNGLLLHPKFSIFSKVLITMMILSLLPMSVYTLFTLQRIIRVRTETISRVNRSLDLQTRENLLQQAVQTAELVREFLLDREADLQILSRIPVNRGAYLQFARGKIREVWYLGGTPAAPCEIRERLPLYKEIV